MLNIKSYNDFSQFLNNKLLIKGVIFGVGVTAFMRFFPGLFVKNFKIITFKDSTDNQALHEFCEEIFVLQKKRPTIKLKFTNANNILRNKTVHKYIKAQPGKKYLFLYKENQNIINAVKDLDVKFISNQPALNKYFENKANFRKILSRLKISPITGETLAFSEWQKKDYNYFVQKYGSKFVLQLPDFMLGGGKGTLFIDSVKKFKAFKRETADGQYKNKILTVINVTKFIEGTSCSVACCATKYGTLISKIQQQIIDIPQVISPKKGNGLFVGHVFGNQFSPAITKQAQQIASSLGNYMYKKGYRGIFGIDLLINQKANQVYPVECNARYTGAFPMLSMIHLKNQIIPLDFWHFLEFLKIPYKINLKQINQMYQKPISGSHIILSNTRNHSIVVKNELPVGTYTFKNNKINYQSDNIFYQDLKNDNDFILVDGVPKKGAEIKKWNRFARIVHVLFNANILQANNQLKDKYLQLVYAIYKAMFNKKQIIYKPSKPRSQTIIDQTVRGFLGKRTITTPDDLIVLRNLIWQKIKFRPYNKKTQKQADQLQWKRTASQIMRDKYVYSGKACSDLTLVFITLCKAAGLEAKLVKLVTLDNKSSHTIAEVKLKSKWYRIDPSSQDSVPFSGRLNKNSIWNKKYRVFKKGNDLWELGLDSIEAETKICK